MCLKHYHMDIYKLELKGDKATPSLNKAIYIGASYIF